jgi:DNA polymerase III epsilon subunit-like protein
MNQHHIFFAVGVTDGALSSIAAVRTDEEGTVQSATFGDKLRGDGSVLLITAIETMRKGVLDDRSDKYVVVSHYEAPRILLKVACKEAGIDMPFPTDRIWLDTAQLVWPVVASGALDSRSIESMAHFYGVECPKSRDAAKEALVIADVYWRMMARYMMAQKVENTGRRVVANMIDSVIGRGGIKQAVPKEQR